MKEYEKLAEEYWNTWRKTDEWLSKRLQIIVQESYQAGFVKACDMHLKFHENLWNEISQPYEREDIMRIGMNEV